MKKLFFLLLALTLVLAVLPALAEKSDGIVLEINTQEEADALYKQYANTFNGKNVRLKISGDRDIYIPFLLRFSFDSLTLDVPAVSDSIGTSVKEIENLTELESPSDIFNSESATTLRRLTTRLDTVDQAVDIAQAGLYVPNLESWTLSFSSSKGYKAYLSRGICLPESLSTVVITLNGQPVIPQEEFAGQLIAALKVINPQATLNGESVANLDETAGLDEEAAVKVRQIPADMALESLYSQIEGNTMPELPGDPVLGRKIAVLIRDSSTFENSVGGMLANEDFYDLPRDRLAVNMDEADTAVIVYRVGNRVGMYTNGVQAYATKTMVAVVDLARGAMYAPYVAAYQDPPSTIKGFGGNTGRFLPENALMYIARLLEVS